MTKCELCGEPMPAGEEMFKYHGYSGPCPKPPLPKAAPSSAPETSSMQKLIDAARMLCADAKPIDGETGFVKVRREAIGLLRLSLNFVDDDSKDQAP